MDDNDKTFRNLDLVNNRYAQAQKALFSLFSQLSGVLIILGFLPRAIKAYEHGISFAPLNITEDLSFFALFWSPTIVGTTVFLITYLWYLHYLSRQLVRPEDWTQEEKEKIYKLRKIVMRITKIKNPRINKRMRKLLCLYHLFYNDQKRNLRGCVIVILILTIFVAFLVYYVNIPDLRYQIEKKYKINLIYFLNNFISYILKTLSYSMFFSSLLAGLYIPNQRFAVWMNSIIRIIPLIIIISNFFEMISAIDKYPQQYGGFKPESYIAKWKGEDKEKRITVVYKTDKFLFCKPEDAQKNPNWKCTILSTEGLERLVPDTQKQASNQEPH
ncbi:hypothetical protein EM20IM_09170 [Candidatus Methylacidiphilum infernorum]|uniref:Uncharacterized protein n=1 Tax=Candidatus Methylacidiphilum infernorum TaxID=511746 RepID=A0ABX7PVN0_9BACT|nr:hypothetical protein [Candidatus Methylacidiphilum infernorum]QSR86636.1 hypothetical protein EM20IM_09170 [Candidatus Methylacidiphilum infernorum]